MGEARGVRLSRAPMRLTACLLLLSVATLLADPPASGRWEGTIAIPGQDLSVVVDLAQDSSGRWQGSVIIPPMRISGAAVTDISVDASKVSFAIKSALAEQRAGPAKFNGQFATDGTLAGDFTQGGNTAQFRLKKTGPSQVAQSPHSTAIAKELEGEWQGGYELLGYPRKVTLKLQNRGDEGATAEWVIVGRKTNNLPVSLVRQENQYLMVDSADTGLSFEGRAGKDGIKGIITQGPMEIPVLMKRATN